MNPSRLPHNSGIRQVDTQDYLEMKNNGPASTKLRGKAVIAKSGRYYGSRDLPEGGKC